jgi:hypothetical protein
MDVTRGLLGPERRRVSAVQPSDFAQRLWVALSERLEIVAPARAGASHPLAVHVEHHNDHDHNGQYAQTDLSRVGLDALHVDAELVGQFVGLQFVTVLGFHLRWRSML